jgi:hypothetical protein
VLEVYHRPRDPDRPLVCLDETSKQLITETRVPIAAKPGQPERFDYEYQRNGTANLFRLFAPLEGWRHVEVTDRHAALDYAQILKDLSDMYSRWCRRSYSCRTISALTHLLHFTRSFRLLKPAVWSNDSSGTTPQNTAVGWIWLKPNLACCRRNVWIAVSRTSILRPTNRRLGERPQQAPCQSRLAIHRGRCPR